MREYGTENESYFRYATERLSTCIQAVTNVRDHLEHLEDDDRVVVARYVQQLTEVEGLVRDLVGIWETKLTVTMSRWLTALRCFSLTEEVGSALKIPGINWSTSHHCHLPGLKSLHLLGFCG